MHQKNRFLNLLSMLFLVGCASVSRDCSSCSADNFGADWIIVQFRADGSPSSCWKLKNTAVDNESASDGIYWKDPHNGNMVHISGWYNRVQVTGGEWDAAAQNLGIKLSACQDGAYTP